MNKCKECGKEFESACYQHQFCSNRCRTKFYSKKAKLAVCPKCGKKARVVHPESYICRECKNGKPKEPVKHRPRFTINEVMAVQQALKRTRKKDLDYATVSTMLANDEIIVDKFYQSDKRIIAEVHLKRGRKKRRR